MKRKHSTWRAGVLLLYGALFFGYSRSSLAQVRRAEAGDLKYHVDSEVVLVPVTVTDRGGANLNALRKEDFVVLDNKQRQPIAALYSEDVPCSIGIVLDVSGSVSGHLTREKAAMHAFLAAANPDDDFFLMTVSSAPALRAGPASDSRTIEDQIREEFAGGWTALFDTIQQAAEQVKHGRHARRVLLVVSDGMDNHSRHTRSDVIRSLVESDVQVYTIAMQAAPGSLKGVQLCEMLNGLAFMDDLAARTGGLSLHAGENENPALAADKISRAMRNQYVIGYRAPGMAGSGKWHSIRVKVDRRNANAYARSGYSEP